MAEVLKVYRSMKHRQSDVLRRCCEFCNSSKPCNNPLIHNKQNLSFFIKLQEKSILLPKIQKSSSICSQRQIKGETKRKGSNVKSNWFLKKLEMYSEQNERSLSTLNQEGINKFNLNLG